MSLRHIVPILVVLAITAPAAAQPAGAQAEQLFKDGKRLMGDKQFAEACAAFAASQQLEASIATLANLADCREKNAQLATSWAMWLDVIQQTRDDKQQKALNKTAQTRADGLEKRVSYLTINVPDQSRVEGLTVSRNGEPVDSLLWNQRLPIDGGTYTVEGKAPGHEPWSTTVTVQTDSDQQQVDVPRFKSVPDPIVKDDLRPVHDGDAIDEREPTPGMSGKRKAAIGLGVVGVLGLATGLVFELKAKGTREDATAEPDDQRQRDLTDKANSQRTLALIGGGTGVVCLGVAAYLWFTGGVSAADQDAAHARLAPVIGPALIGVSLAGGF